MLVILEEGATGLTRARYYSQRDVQKASEVLIQRLKSLGYLSAKITTINRR